MQKPDEPDDLGLGGRDRRAEAETKPGGPHIRGLPAGEHDIGEIRNIMCQIASRLRTAHVHDIEFQLIGIAFKLDCVC